ncbi:hypothetical protein KP509_15G052800 [Ceratopteris richardii]|uniref:Plant heme peroxidase family profile domain-containing protein n=1 Tax=Ceratopteris richardii TaxID=49495 RepID=A0A8T2T541_CERRI|nr:hypothetical protein KP509_15G052800 [Ceratopteris richardii]
MKRSLVRYSEMLPSLQDFSVRRFTIVLYRDVTNRNSLHGLEAIDEAKRALEQECPGLISCADII